MLWTIDPFLWTVDHIIIGLAVPGRSCSGQYVSFRLYHRSVPWADARSLCGCLHHISWSQTFLLSTLTRRRPSQCWWVSLQICPVGRLSSAHSRRLYYLQQPCVLWYTNEYMHDSCFRVRSTVPEMKQVASSCGYDSKCSISQWDMLPFRSSNHILLS